MGLPVYTDSHAHLSDLAKGQAEVFQELMAAYAEAWQDPMKPLLVDIGVEAGDFSRRLALLGRHPFLRFSLGLWPGEPALADPHAALASLARDLELAGPDAAAIGECGLDYRHMEAAASVQALLFEGQVALAREGNLPLVVHSREAFADTLAILEGGAGSMPVIIHCFGYGPSEARAFLDRGYFLSFAGNLSYKKAQDLREAIVLVPRERLLLETDAPYMNPEPRRGKPSTPADIGRTYALAAELRHEPIEDLSQSISENARRIFG